MMTLLAGLGTIEDESWELLMANGWFLRAKLVPELTIFKTAVRRAIILKNAVSRSSPLRHARPSIAPPEVSKDIRANGLLTKRVSASKTVRADV